MRRRARAGVARVPAGRMPTRARASVRHTCSSPIVDPWNPAITLRMEAVARRVLSAPLCTGDTMEAGGTRVGMHDMGAAVAPLIAKAV